MRSSSTTKNLKDALSSDNRFMRLKAAFKTMPEQLPMSIEDLMSEVKTLHKIRSVRNLQANDPNILTKMSESFAQEQSLRSRLTEILMVSIRVETVLSEALKSFSQYALIEHSSMLSHLKTKGEREDAIAMVLVSYHGYITSLKTLQKMVTLAVDDIDKSAYRIGDLFKAIQLIGKPEKYLA